VSFETFRTGHERSIGTSLELLESGQVEAHLSGKQPEALQTTPRPRRLESIRRHALSAAAFIVARSVESSLNSRFSTATADTLHSRPDWRLGRGALESRVTSGRVAILLHKGARLCTRLEEATVRLSLTISGAVALGAYEGGVLAALLYAIRPLVTDPTEPARIDVMSGASAGSITALLAARALLEGHDPLRVMSAVWVERDSIGALLAHGDDAPLSIDSLRVNGKRLAWQDE
jgi:Patatin-like phospholipase